MSASSAGVAPQAWGLTEVPATRIVMRVAVVLALAAAQTGQAFLQTGRAHANAIGPRLLHSAQSRWVAGSFSPRMLSQEEEDRLVAEEMRRREQVAAGGGPINLFYCA